MSFDGQDLRPFLDEWDYEEASTVRRVSTPDGREVLQVRLPLGVEQYELHGRPDGRRPEDAESWFHVFRARAEASPWSFTLDEWSFDRLREECMLYYHRYLLFFQISEYKLCVRDTERNLVVLDFAGKFSEPKRAASLEQYRPYILRMHAMARALDEIQETGDVSIALAILERGIEDIETLPLLEDNSVFDVEKKRSLSSLRDLYRQLRNYLPAPLVDTLRNRLDEAIAAENYEEAARIRDQIADAHGPDRG